MGDLILFNLMLGTVQTVGGVCSMCVCSMLFNACVHVVLVLIVYVCVCMFVYLCVCVCVSVTTLAGATGPFKSKVSSFPPNLPYRCQLIQQLLHDGTCLKQL